MVSQEEQPTVQTNANGDTIRIFRRSRSGRPSNNNLEGGASETNSDDKMLRTEDLPTPDTSAAVKEANAK